MQMSRGRYNIPKKYRVDKGMPLEALSQRIANTKCRQIFETEIESMTWCYQIVDEDNLTDTSALIRQNGISVFEVHMKSKVSTELLTELLAGLIPKRTVITYICDNELAVATFIPAEKGFAAKICATDYYPFDISRMIEVLDFEKDCDKPVTEVYKRIFMTIRQQKRIIMIEKAFENISKSKSQSQEKPQQQQMDFEFAIENLAKIREDAKYVQDQLHVEMHNVDAMA